MIEKIRWNGRLCPKFSYPTNLSARCVKLWPNLWMNWIPADTLTRYPWYGSPYYTILCDVCIAEKRLDLCVSSSRTLITNYLSLSLSLRLFPFRRQFDFCTQFNFVGGDRKLPASKVGPAI